MESGMEKSAGVQEDLWLQTGAAEKAASVIELTRELPIRDVLEIGCGTGAILEELDRREFASRYWACEPSEPMFAQLANKHISRLVCSAATTLEASPFAGERFDLVILSHVLEHVVDPGRLLAAALQRADHAVVEVPIEGNLLGNVRARVKRSWTGQPRLANAAGHVQFYSISDISKLVRWVGSEVVCSRIYFPLAPYRSGATGGWHPYRQAILGLRALAGDAMMTRLYYGHLAVLVRAAASPSATEGYDHRLFWRPRST
jgi:SAM-dependent methyltransferase